MSVSFHNRPVQTINNHYNTRLNPGLNLVDGNLHCQETVNTVNPRISPLGAYLFFTILDGGSFEEGLYEGGRLIVEIKKTLLKDFVYFRRNFFMSIELIITIDFCGNSIKRQKQPKMAKIVQLRAPIREFMVAVGALFERGLIDNF